MPGFTDRLPALRPGQPAPQSLVERRAAIAAMRQDVNDPAVELVERSRGGVAGLECLVRNAQRTIIHFHGGGYRLGDSKGWAAWGARLAKAAQANVVLPDYRLAPENPFPAAIHDAVAVYADLLGQRTKGLLLSGDSAGGGLAAALVVACPQVSLALPPGLILISPWLDLTVEATTFTSRATTDKLFSREAATEGSQQYLQGHSARDRLASPAFAELKGFPPTQIFAGGDEVLLGDSTAFATRLADAGVTVEAHFVAGMQHVWPTIFPDLKESAAALESMVRFARRVAPDA